MASYQFYNSLSYGLPLAFLVVTPFGIFGLVLIAVFFSAVFLDRGKRSYGWKGAFKILKQIFGDELDDPEQGPGPNQSFIDESEIYTPQRVSHRDYVLYGIQIPKKKLILMFASVMCIYFCTLVSFWSDLVFRESNQCDNNLDCFAFDASSGLVQQEPLGENCTFYTEGFTIKCYEIVFDYVTAIGNAGSVLVVGALVMTIQSFISAGAVHIWHRSKGHKLKRGLIATLTLVYYFISSTAIFFIPLLIAIPQSVRDAIWNTDASYVRFFSYYFTFLIAYLSSGPLLIIKMERCKCDLEIFESVYDKSAQNVFQP